MKKGYLFISNGFKPTSIEAESIDPIAPGSFSRTAIEAAEEMGWELNMGINRNHPEEVKSLGFDIKFYNSNTFRNIFALRDNIKAYNNLCDYLKRNPQIEVIHCNTPIGGVVGRLAGYKFKKRVIYTAHGFHFFKGAPWIYNFLFKKIEKFLARFTDVLITINNEDFEAAKQFKLKDNGKVFLVPGIGIRSVPVELKKSKEEVLKGIGLPQDSKICISMGDLIKRKNYRPAIKAIEIIGNPKVHYLICGRGPELKNLQKYVDDLGLSKQVHFLGFRKDIMDLLSISDCFLLSSLQEGLPRSTMEAMLCGLPCVVSDIRGNRDLIEDRQGGFLVNPNNPDGFANAIQRILSNNTLAHSMGDWNKERIKKFSFDKVKNQLKYIYTIINV